MRGYGYGETDTSLMRIANRDLSVDRTCNIVIFHSFLAGVVSVASARLRISVEWNVHEVSSTNSLQRNSVLLSLLLFPLVFSTNKNVEVIGCVVSNMNFRLFLLA